MHALQDRLWNPQCMVPTLAPRPITPKDQDPRLILKEFSHDISTEIPKLGNLAHREVALLKARGWRLALTIETDSVIGHLETSHGIAVALTSS